MNRLIIVVIALVLSACSYDPYHYYYKCPNTPLIHVHNDVLKLRQQEYTFWKELEDDRFWVYHAEDIGTIYMEKGTNRITDGTLSLMDCTVEKTLFKK